MMVCSWRQWSPLQQVLRFQIWCHTVLPCELSIHGCSFHFYSNGKSLASIPLTLGNLEEIPCHPTKAMNPNSVPSPQTNFNLLSNGRFVYFSCRHDSWQETTAAHNDEPWEITLDPFPYFIPTPLHRESHDFWDVSVLDKVFCMERNWQEVIHMKGIYLKLIFIFFTYWIVQISDAVVSYLVLDFQGRQAFSRLLSSALAVAALYL